MKNFIQKILNMFIPHIYYECLRSIFSDDYALLENVNDRRRKSNQPTKENKMCEKTCENCNWSFNGRMCTTGDNKDSTWVGSCRYDPPNNLIQKGSNRVMIIEQLPMVTGTDICSKWEPKQNEP